MRCPKCDSRRLIVTDSRSRKKYIRRRRECRECRHRFTTYEMTQEEKENLIRLAMIDITIKFEKIIKKLKGE